MNWLRKAAALDFSKSDDDQFETGRPVEFPSLRFNQPAPDMGDRYQQHIEPAGRYIIKNENDPSYEPPEPWIKDTISFQNPLVIPFNTKPDNSAYDEFSWKHRLADHYGKTGLELSLALIDDGYDGIVTVYIDPDGNPRYTKEIVDLRPIIAQYR
jgi:hypothetical protein